MADVRILLALCERADEEIIPIRQEAVCIDSLQ